MYTQLYIHLRKHKIPHSFDHCDCIVFRLYAELLSTHGPNLAYCAIFLNKLIFTRYHYIVSGGQDLLYNSVIMVIVITKGSQLNALSLDTLRHQRGFSYVQYLLVNDSEASVCNILIKRTTNFKV